MSFVPVEDRYTPQYKTPGAACCDLVARIDPLPGSTRRMISLPHRQTALVPTGVRAAIPPGYKLCIAARSGHASHGLVVTNAPGQIDSDYRDEIKVIVTNVGRETLEIHDGKRFAQCWIEPVYAAAWKKVAELPPAEPGRTGGFGSTGDA